ncbi:MAG: phosphate acyltransferase PlsX [Candidatus Omnitrophica bacterium]|nr:phosphate acyltransferase PlsX [Candidatus Omnitrophota bacterium]MCF7894517.1 phosphate acyltransferase PlsX [Candidatus Omnitrophota bacterium]
MAKFKIGIDASGGDLAPLEIVKGAILAKKEIDQELVLIGDKEKIRKELKKYKVDFAIVDAPEKINMAEAPVSAVRKKRNSSIVVGCKLLKKREIDAFVSCGNTGAVVCASALILKFIEGVERPGIALMFPTQKGVSLLIDAGANIDCKPIHLLQYGVMASVYYSTVLEKERPTVGLLNIGEEASKGLEVLKNTHKLFELSSLNFSGNIEAKSILSGSSDCIVCDGFVGNIALKVLEGSTEAMGKLFIEFMKKSLPGRLGLLLAKGNLKKLKESIDYSEYGGAPLLGVDGAVIIGHGRSDAKAVKNAIGAAARELKRKLNERIKEKINETCQDSRIRQILAA